MKALVRICRKILVALGCENADLDLRTLGYENFDFESFWFIKPRLL